MLEGEPIRIPKAAVVVASRIRRSIVQGRLLPGQALPNETELMGLYQVSRSVVREALRILESESLIRVKRGAGGGARVATPDSGMAARPTALLLQMEGTTLEDLFEARSLLEPAAVRRLATVRPPETLERLRQRHAEEVALLGDAAALYVDAAVAHWERHLRRAADLALEHLGPATVIDLLDRPA